MKALNLIVPIAMILLIGMWIGAKFFGSVIVESDVTRIETELSVSVSRIDSLENLIGSIEDVEPIVIHRTNTIRVVDSTEIRNLREVIKDLRSADPDIVIDLDSLYIDIFIASLKVSKLTSVLIPLIF